MSVIKMGPVIAQIKNHVEQSLPRKVLNFLLFQVHKVTWALWGRRKAFKKMQRLALTSPPPYPRVSLAKEEERVSRHRMHLDSLQAREYLPPPDSEEDVGIN